MATVEEISIAQRPEMALIIRQAVEAGQEASSGEVVRDPLRDWQYNRRLRQQGADDLRDF